MEKRGTKTGFLLALIDVLSIVALLVVFAYFHHVRAHTLGEPKETLLSGDALGDFSEAFPTAPCSESAYRSYADENVRIEITKSEADNLCYYVADVWIKSMESLKTAFAGDAFVTGTANYAQVQELADRNNAILAINADISCRKESGVVLRNGILYRERGALEDVCVLYADGTMETVSGEAFDLDAAGAKGAYQTFTFGPTLIHNGEVPTEYNCSAKLRRRNPRAAIGYYEPGHYCLVVVDGRQNGYSRGLSTEGMSQLFLRLGCTEAYNLDGGASAAMVFRGELLSRPCGRRTVSEILYIG